MDNPDSVSEAAACQKTACEKPDEFEDGLSKAEQHFDQYLQNLKLKVEDGSVRRMVGRRARDVSGRWIYVCFPCGATCSGENVLQVHISGNKHRFKLKTNQVWPISIFNYFPTKKVNSNPEVNTAAASNTPVQTKNNRVLDEFELKYEQYRSVNCHIQESLDNLKSSILGLEYLVEHSPEQEQYSPSYMCTLCVKQGQSHTILNHLTSHWHRYTYLVRHFPTACDKLNPYFSDKRYRTEVVYILNILAQRIEDKYGRKRPVNIDKYEYERDKDHILRWIARDHHFSEKDGSTFVEVVNEELIESLFSARDAQEDKDAKNLQISPAAVSSKIQSGHNQKADSVASLSNFSGEIDKHQNKETDCFATNKAFHKARFEPYKRVAPHIPNRNAKFKQKQPNHVWKLKMAEEMCAATEESAKQTLAYHVKNPEKHPMYPEEWKKFWSKRYKEIKAEGKDPAKHDFKAEWIVFWTARMKELHDEELRVQVNELYRKLGMTPSDENQQDLDDEQKPQNESSSSVPSNEVKKPEPSAQRPRSPPDQRRVLERRASPDRGKDSTDRRRTSPDQRISSPDRRRSPFDQRRSPLDQRRSSDRRRPSADRRRPTLDRPRPTPDRRRPTPGQSRSSPDRRRDPPDWRRTSADRHKASLDQLTSSSEQRRASSDRHKASSDQRIASSDRCIGSPDRHKASPDRRKPQPDQLKASPDHRKTSSDHYKDSPDRNNASLSRLNTSPDRLKAYSDQYKAFPDRRRSSPDRRRAYPDQIRSSPDQRREYRSREPQPGRPYRQDHRSRHYTRWLSPELRRSPTRHKCSRSRCSLHRRSPLRNRSHERGNHIASSLKTKIERKPNNIDPITSGPGATTPSLPSSDRLAQPFDDLMATLRQLVALEDYLGSLGPRVVNLLSEALTMEKQRPTSSEELLERDSALVLLETAKEKLKGAAQAGLVSGSAAAAVRAAVVRVAATLHEADKRVKRKKQESLATAAKVTSVPVGSGEMDRAHIAQQIAVELIAQGKTNVSSEELAQLVEAVVTESKKRQTERTKIAEASDAADKTASAKICGTACALQALQAEYKKKDKTLKEDSLDAIMGLSDSDVETLLKNFHQLSSEEQYNLAAYLKKLEAKEPNRVECLSQYLNNTTTTAATPTDSQQEPVNKERQLTAPLEAKKDHTDTTIKEVIHSSSQNNQKFEMDQENIDIPKPEQIKQEQPLESYLKDITKDLASSTDLFALIKGSPSAAPNIPKELSSDDELDSIDDLLGDLKTGVESSQLQIPESPKQPATLMTPLSLSSKASSIESSYSKQGVMLPLKHEQERTEQLSPQLKSDTFLTQDSQQSPQQESYKNQNLNLQTRQNRPPLEKVQESIDTWPHFDDNRHQQFQNQFSNNNRQDNRGPIVSGPRPNNNSYNQGPRYNFMNGRIQNNYNSRPQNMNNQFERFDSLQNNFRGRGGFYMRGRGRGYY